MTVCAIAMVGKNFFQAIRVEDVSTGIHRDKPYELIHVDSEQVDGLIAQVNGMIEAEQAKLDRFNSQYPKRKREVMDMAQINYAILISGLGFRPEYVIEGYRAWS